MPSKLAAAASPLPFHRLWNAFLTARVMVALALLLLALPPLWSDRQHLRMAWQQWRQRHGRNDMPPRLPPHLD